MTKSMANTEIVITLGGTIKGREHLITWIPTMIIIPRGRLRCKKCRTKNSSSLNVSLLRNDMERGSTKRWISFSSSAVFKATS
ncbi:MAG: hypothetical protein A2Z59_04275 [Nitrospinae bacterium RIFCSPLOWO2_02_39_17]|nr:MAG: hypothetical protein A2Z59_04275 [Nitrospinae bacterium RIFCSPLOWO2_02_39_17]